MKKDFYLYKCLREIHREKQMQLLEESNNGIILILNTPGSLEHFMVHTDPHKIKLIFDTLLDHVINTISKGSIEIGYKLGKEDKISCYVKEPPMPVYSLARFENRFEQEAALISAITSHLDDMGGSIWIEKTPENPKIFWFSLDIQPPGLNAGRDKADHTILTAPNWSDRTILIVDDVHSNLLLLENILAPTRARVISVDNGQKAVNAVKKEKTIDLVLMDVRMPVLDGYEATKRIKRFQPWLPVVAISAFSSSSESENWKNAGCNAFLGKPLNSFELTKTIQSLLENVQVLLK